jgi:hypothetical protein
VHGLLCARLSDRCRTGVAVCGPQLASELTSSNALAQEAEFTLEMVLRVDHERVSWSAVTQIVSYVEINLWPRVEKKIIELILCSCDYSMDHLAELCGRDGLVVEA